MASQVGSATLPIFPVMNGFRSKVTKEVTAAGTAGSNAFTKSFNATRQGATIGTQLKKGFTSTSQNLASDVLKKAQRDVAQATSANAKAMLNQKGAANQVQAAEDKLAAAISKRDQATDNAKSAQDALNKAIAEHGQNSAQAQSAQAALNKALEAQASATTAAEGAQIRLEKANLSLASAQSKAEASALRLKTAQEALKNTQNTLEGSAQQASNGIIKSFANLGTTILTPLTTAFKTIGSSISPHLKKAVAPVTSFANTVQTKISTGFTTAKTAAQKALTAIPTAAVSAFNKLPTGIQSALKSTSSYLGNIVTASGNVFHAVGAAGMNAMQTLATTAANATKSIGTHLANAAHSAHEALQNMASVSMAALATGATVLGAKLFDVGKQAYGLYASYEQAVGGIDTLFKGASSTVQKYAAKAYKTAGVSANTYMEQITSFSASLISSLGGDTAKAAELGNTAMIDMSDNANKMGTSIESIQQTYQSLARGNYAMLDNLKLGYGGTKTEMQRMISDANEVRAANGEMANLSIDSFADVVTAIHTIQGEMDITGTTAKEAATTIEGATGAMKAAWENWLTGLGRDDANLDELTQQLVDSIAIMLQNAIPRIKQIAVSMFHAIPDAAKGLIKLLPEPLQQAIDKISSVVGGAKKLFAPLTAAFAALGAGGLAPLLKHVPLIGGALSNLLGPLKVLSGPIGLLTAAIGGLIATSPKLQGEFAGSFKLLGSTVKKISKQLEPIIEGLGNAVMDTVNAIMPVVENMVAQLAPVITAILQVLAEQAPQIMAYISAAIQAMLPSIQQVVTVLAQAVTSVLPVVSQILTALMPVMTQIITSLLPLVPSILNPLMSVVTALVPVIQQVLLSLSPIVQQILPLLGTAITTIIDAVMPVIDMILPMLASLITSLAPVVTDVITTISTLIQELMPVVQMVVDTIVSFITSVIMPAVEGMLPVVQSVIGTISSVVQNVATVIGGVVDVIAGIFSGDWSRVWDGFKNIAKGAIDAVKNIFSGAVDIGSNLVKGIWNGISNVKDWIMDKIRGFGSWITDGIKGIFGINSPSRVMRDQVGKMLGQGIGVGLEASETSLYQQVDSLANEINRRASQALDMSGKTDLSLNTTSSNPANSQAGSYPTNGGVVVNNTINAQGVTSAQVFDEFNIRTRRAVSGWGE